MRKLLYNYGLGTRIYIAMVLMVLISLVITGITTIYYFKSENDRYHHERLQRQENSIILSLSYFTVENEINELSPNLENKIHRVAEINNLDLNVYSPGGILLGSTRFDLFDSGMLSPSLSDSVLKVLDEKQHFVTEENMGDQSFLSTYFILDDSKGDPLAIINLPYRKDEEILRQRINEFLIALAQVYILLFIGSLVIAYFLSAYITKSLQRISARLKEVRFTEKNAPIEWHADDEIGELVDDYNRMLRDLEVSAELLAKTERESAWKEMARQVAHEIKNPLTPMKLSIQHLQRVAANNPPDLHEKLDRLGENLVFQIDALSKIASAFSDFAKMPEAEFKRVELIPLLSEVAELYNTKDEVVIEKNEELKGIAVMADENHLIRIFNNLISNALHSVPEDRKPQVKIKLKRTEQKVFIDVIDNGSGVPKEVVEKIFTPNFTTKSGGMGLGLAMVKTMLASNNGDISFKTKENEGSVFTVQLQVADQPKEND